MTQGTKSLCVESIASDSDTWLKKKKKAACCFVYTFFRSVLLQDFGQVPTRQLQGYTVQASVCMITLLSSHRKLKSLVVYVSLTFFYI